MKFHSDNSNLQRIADELLKDRRRIPNFATDEELIDFIRFQSDEADISAFFEKYRLKYQAAVLAAR